MTIPPETGSVPLPRIDYAAVEKGAAFVDLKRAHRRFVFPVVIAATVWYLAFVLVGAFAPGTMATPVFNVVNLGLLLGLAQFVTTFAITAWYVAFATRRLDPATARLRAELEAQEQKAQEQK